jgi:hypothetical protein
MPALIQRFIHSGNALMRRQRFVLVAAALLLPCAGWAQSAAVPTVSSDAGNIFLNRGGAKIRLTASEMDVDPVLAPGGGFVVYTRQGRGRSQHGNDAPQFCIVAPAPDELRAVNIDGGGDRLLVAGRRGDPEQQLCDFRNKQFSADGRRLYFLTPGWTTSGALHVYDLRATEEHFLLPANDVLVLNFCTGKYRDGLAVEQHRYFLFGGSYDWYWLYDSAGKKELGPLGAFANAEELMRQAHGEWCEATR